MFCRHCGIESKQDAKFCHNCGNTHLYKTNSTNTIWVPNEKIQNKSFLKHSAKNIIFISLGVLLSLGALLIGGVIAVDLMKKTNQNTQVNTSPQSVVKPFSIEDGEKTINKYFNFLDRKDYTEAYNIFSSGEQNRREFKSWKNGYKNTIGHVVDSISCFDFVCTVSLTATENNSQSLQRAEYTSKFYLNYDVNENLKIDKVVSISHSIKEILKTNTQGIDNNFLLGSVVKVLCTDPTFETISQGSGTVITEGMVLSNFHVQMGYPNYCIVKQVDDQGILTEDVYNVDYSVVENPSYDFWVFHIVRNVENINADPNPLPLLACTENQIQIGDNVRILGFPYAGGDNITVTEGIVSGHVDKISGLYITSAKIDHGNSGGAAIDISKNCFLGIPTVARAGELESYGGIRGLYKVLEIEPSLLSNN